MYIDFSLHIDKHMVQKLDLYINSNREFFSNTLIKSFLKNTNHLNLLAEWLYYQKYDSKIKLDNAFKEFYFEIRILAYITTLIDRGSRDFDIKNRNYDQRFINVIQQDTDGESMFLNYIPSPDNTEKKF